MAQSYANIGKKQKIKNMIEEKNEILTTYLGLNWLQKRAFYTIIMERCNVSRRTLYRRLKENTWKWNEKEIVDEVLKEITSKESSLKLLSL